MTDRWAVINPETKQVVNVIIWDGQGREPYNGHLHVCHEDCDMGDTYDAETNTFIKPPERSHK